jgi:hypothetical protein
MPSPPMQISPGTPMGQGCIWRRGSTRRCCRWACRSDTPRAATRRAACATRWTTRWSRWGRRRSTARCSARAAPAPGARAPARRRSSRGRPGPALFALCSLRPCHCASSSNCHMPGVACRMVMRCASSSARRRLPSMAVSRCTRTICAPAASGSSTSGTAMSKDSVVTAAMRSSRADAGLALHRLQQVGHRAVRHAHALGLAGGARGVDDVGGVVGARVPGCPATVRRRGLFARRCRGRSRTHGRRHRRVPRARAAAMPEEVSSRLKLRRPAA